MKNLQPHDPGATSPDSTEQWLPATVALEGIGEYRAQITLARWNGAAIPRFEREVMERIVRNQHALHEDYAAEGLGHMFLDLAWDEGRVLIRDHSETDPEHGTTYIEDVLGPDEEGFYRYGGGFLCWETVTEHWPNSTQTLLELTASAEAEQRYHNRRAITDGTAEDCSADAARAADEALYGVVIGFGIPLTGADEAIEFLGRALEDRARYRARTRRDPTGEVRG